MDELVSMVESTSVVGMIMDSLIEVSSFVGEVNVVWNNLLNDDMLKEAIMKKLEQEDKDNTMMLECQIREERLLKQKNARDAWMTAKINKDVSFLIDSLSKIELEKEDDLNYDLDEEGDSIMSNIDVKESEEEMDAILNQMMNNLEGGGMVTGNVIASTVRPGWKSSQADRPGSEPGTIPDDDDRMVEDDPETDAEVDEDMDDNDTILTNQDNGFEEWVVKELSVFHVGAITNLKVGLVDTDNLGWALGT